MINYVRKEAFKLNNYRIYKDKKYWITVELESDVPDELVKRLISHSVDEVVKKMPKSKQRLYYEM